MVAIAATRVCCRKPSFVLKLMQYRHTFQITRKKSTSSPTDGVKLQHKDLFHYFMLAHRHLSTDSVSKASWPPSLLEFLGHTPKTAMVNLEILKNDIGTLFRTLDSYKEIESFVSEALTETKSDEKDDLIAIAEDEKQELIAEIKSSDKNIILKLCSMMEKDDLVSSALLEVSAGVGGQEAMLFAAELFEMYEAFCIRFGQNFETMNVEYSDIGGVKKSSAKIYFNDISMYQLLQNEIGTHRVQRVPETERSGRIHTSTASVALLPFFNNESEVLDEKSIEIQRFKRSSTGGGQHANKTESAVRIKHIQSGKIVECNATRSQHENKERALQMLAAILSSEKRNSRQSALVKARQQQVKNRERSDKIRTYNFGQDRITDHRIGFTTHGIIKFMTGETMLLNLMKKLNDKAKLDELNVTSKILLDEGKSYFKNSKASTTA